MPPKRLQKRARPTPPVRRRNRPRKRLQTNALTRTQNQIERNLSKAISNLSFESNTLPPYLMCRAYPFDAKPSNGIPDGDMTKKIVIDHRAYSTVVVGASQGFAVTMVPWLPHCLLFKAQGANTGFTVGGLTPDPQSIYTNLGRWMPMLSFPEFTSYYNQTATGPSEVLNPYSCSQFRIVTMATRITFVGVPTAASGTVTVYNDACPTDYSRRINNAVLTNVGVAGTIALGTVYVVNADLNVPQPSLSSETYVSRIDTPVMVRPKHHGPYRWVSTPSTKTYCVDSTLVSATLYPNICGTSTFGAEALGLLGVDSNWDPATMVFEGLTPGTSVRFESIVCVEYVPGVTSDAFRLAKTSSNQPGVVSHTETQIQQMPIAEPAGKARAIR